MRKVKPILKSFPPAHGWKSVLEVKVSITLPEGARCCSIFLKALASGCSLERSFSLDDHPHSPRFLL